MERPEAWREKGVGMWSVRAAECDLMIPGSSTNIKYSDNTCKPGSFHTNTTELRSTWISDSTFYPSVPLHVRHVAVVCGVARTLTDPIGPAALASHCARAIAKRPRHHGGSRRGAILNDHQLVQCLLLLYEFHLLSRTKPFMPLLWKLAKHQASSTSSTRSTGA